MSSPDFGGNVRRLMLKVYDKIIILELQIIFHKYDTFLGPHFI
jgi:hypothetical protein